MLYSFSSLIFHSLGNWSQRHRFSFGLNNILRKINLCTKTCIKHVVERQQFYYCVNTVLKVLAVQIYT